jgi:hypothetical protein
MVPLGASGVSVRLLVATHPASATAASIGVTRDGVVYELFWTVLPQHAFTSADVLELYLHRGSFETVLADEDQEQDPDRWCSHTPCGQEFWQIIAQWVWNLRLELGQQLQPTAMRMTEFAPAQAVESAQAVVPAQAVEPAQAVHPVSYGPPQWARRSYTKGFAGADFSLQADGTLRCRADHPLYPQERRPERDGSLRVLYAARIGHCRSCPLRSQCQENGTATLKPRRVSAVFWPVASRPPALVERAALVVPPPAPVESLPPSPPCPVLWGDWERCQIRRGFLRLLRTQTVVLVPGLANLQEKEDGKSKASTNQSTTSALASQLA